MNTVFILVEPAVPENIGAAARAIKVMGFTDLWLVNPANHLANEAKWLAHASHEILENARVFNSLQDAANEVDYLIATSAKKRSSNQDYITGDAIIEHLQNKRSLINTIGIVFGREESGLTKEEMKLCDIASYLPMKTTYPSLNLAQAVMLYGYLLSQNPEEPAKENDAVNEMGYRKMKNNIILTLQEIGFSEEHPIFHRIKERLSFLSGKDMNLMLSVISKLREYVSEKLTEK